MSSTRIGTEAETIAAIHGTPKRLSRTMKCGSSPSRAIRYCTEIMSVMVLFMVQHAADAGPFHPIGFIGPCQERRHVFQALTTAR